LKEAPLDELIRSIATVMAGGTWIDRSLSRVEEETASPEPAGGPAFNDRQKRVLRFVMEGLSNKEIAWRLQISESYVKAILQGLFQKTGVRTRGQLVRVAFEQYEDQL
jgi:two-component system nitrate/nitrite response regulator NarL